MNMVARQAAVNPRAAVPEAVSSTALIQARWWTSPFAAVANAVESAVLWSYDILVTRRLRAFYFDTIWGNLPSWQVCAEMTHTNADHWAKTPENIADCQIEMERRFVSWDRAAMTAIWFALLAFVSVKIMCCCWNLDFLPGRNRGGRGACNCGCCSYNRNGENRHHYRRRGHGGNRNSDSDDEEDEFKPVEIEELRRLLLSVRTATAAETESGNNGIAVPIQKKLYSTQQQ